MAKAKTCDLAHRFFHAGRQLDKADLTPSTPVPVSSVQRQSRLSDKGRESFQNHQLQKVGGGKQKKEEEQRLKLKTQLALLKQQKADRLATQVKAEVEDNLVAIKVEALQEMEDREQTEELTVDLKPSVKHIHALKLEPSDPLVAVISTETAKEEEEMEPIVQILDIVASTSSQAYDSIPCATKHKNPSPSLAPRRWSRSLDKGKGKMTEQNSYHPRYRPYTPSPLSRPPINRYPSSSPAPPHLFLPPSPISSEPEQSTVLAQYVTSASAPLSEPKNEGIRMESSQSQTRAENHGIPPQSVRDTPKARPTPPEPPKPPPSHRPREEEDHQPNWGNPFQLPTSSNSTTSPSLQPRFTTTYDWPVYQLPPPSPPIIKPFGSREKEERNSRDEKNEG